MLNDGHTNGGNAMLSIKKPIQPIGNFSSENRNYDNNNLSKKAFDRLITARRRLTRIAIINALYSYEVNKKVLIKANESVLFENLESNTLKHDFLFYNLLYWYKNYFFTKAEYGSTKKTKKLDEQFLFAFLKYTISNIKEIDEKIVPCLSQEWPMSRLNFTIKAILRAAISESMQEYAPNKKIIISEYILATDYFFNGDEFKFVNGVMDRYFKNLDNIKKEEIIESNEQV